MNEFSQESKLKRAEDYISNMISTMMSVSAILATISVGVLAIVGKLKSGFIQLTMTFLIVISVILFIWSFLQGRKSYGKLIWALSQRMEIGFDNAREPLLKCLIILKYGLLSLGLACFIFFLDMLIPYIKASPIREITKMINFKEILISLGYVFIIIGSIGMILFVVKFPLSTNLKDLKLAPERLLRYLNGYQVWLGSWISILVGSAIQILMIWIT